jgi:hypothetical protein
MNWTRVERARRSSRRSKAVYVAGAKVEFPIVGEGAAVEAMYSSPELCNCHLPDWAPLPVKLLVPRAATSSLMSSPLKGRIATCNSTSSSKEQVRSGQVEHAALGSCLGLRVTSEPLRVARAVEAWSLFDVIVTARAHTAFLEVVSRTLGPDDGETKEHPLFSQ